jgi:hypothetical protein
MVEKNVRISSSSLGMEDHGILTAWLHMLGDGWGQGFGGFALDAWNETARKRVGNVACGIFVRRVLETLELDSWEKLAGTHCRVRSRDLSSPLIAIGHIVKDKWFNPAEEFAALEAA